MRTATAFGGVLLCAWARIAVAQEMGPVSLMAPPSPRQMTVVQGNARPFVNGLSGLGAGLIADLTVEHYFRAPLRLSVALSPSTFAVNRARAGGIVHARFGAAYATDFLAVGLAVGGRWARFGPANPTVAGLLRLGSLDGLRFDLTYGYTLRRNDTTGAATLALAHVLSRLEVPLTTRLHAFVEGAFSYEHWLYGTIGLRQRLTAAPHNIWIASAGFGVAWLSDRFPCHYGEEPTPCREVGVWAAGPSLSFGLERRF